MQRRSTKQRDIVHRALKGLYHPTAEEVYEAVRARHPEVGRATVFRNLAVLSEEGLITRLSFPSGTRYDPVADGHAHFSCRTCGRIIDLPPPVGLSLPPTDACIIEACAVKYHGVCRECASSRELS